VRKKKRKGKVPGHLARPREVGEKSYFPTSPAIGLSQAEKGGEKKRGGRKGKKRKAFLKRLLLACWLWLSPKEGEQKKEVKEKKGRKEG